MEGVVSDSRGIGQDSCGVVRASGDIICYWGGVVRDSADASFVNRTNVISVGDNESCRGGKVVPCLLELPP